MSSAERNHDTLLEKVSNEFESSSREWYWEGQFGDYLEIFKKNPQVARTAFRRLYDTIMSYGVENYVENKERLVHYNFFDDKENNGRDAVFGLDRPLMKLVDIFKSAAWGYGNERRVLLLHGPVGGAKSTIVRRLKNGLIDYSKKEEGALYTYGWDKKVVEEDLEETEWEK